jgi:hypothetical protein
MALAKQRMSDILGRGDRAATRRTMAHDVFISYSSKDKAVADAVCATLEAKKIRCWIAPRDVLPGMPYGKALSDALHASRIMVVVLSANSNASQQVMREVESAVDGGITIVPLRIEDVQPSGSMEYFLKAIHWLDALTGPLEEHLQVLAESVHRLLESPSLEPKVDLKAAVGASPARPGHPAVATAPRRPDSRSRVLRTVALSAAGVLLAAVAAYFAWHSFHSRSPAGPDPLAGSSAATSTTSDRQRPPAEVPPEVAVRNLIARFYDLASVKDEDGMAALFLANGSPKTAAAREKLHKTLTETGKITVRQLAIDRVRVDGNQATADVTVLLTGRSLKTGKPFFMDKPWEVNWEFRKEGSAWKIESFTQSSK